MKRALLVLSLLLMTASLTAPFWIRWTSRSPVKRIAGRVTGEFADHPWTGAVVYLGEERSNLKADGKFSFDVPPGIHVLKVCCSPRFDPIRWEVRVKDEDVYLELHAEPLFDIPGHLVIPEEKQVQSLPTVTARRIYTRRIKRAVISAGGTFSLHLSRGDWKVNVENLDAGLTLKSITFAGKEIHDETITIPIKPESTLGLEITLQ
jgi:hypothetical protein